MSVVSNQKEIDVSNSNAYKNGRNKDASKSLMYFIKFMVDWKGN